ncbi:MAG: protein-L-isoaspartate O-methyltransferase [Burkholderiaceae bacterium]
MTPHPIRDNAVERARTNMIEQQIRTWDVLSLDVLDLLERVHREKFVPPAYKALAFVDTEIPLVVDGEETGETMLHPKFEARVLQEVAIQRNETILEIGTGSGYMAALLGCSGASAVSVEIHPRLKAFAEANLARAGVHNVRVDLGNGADGWPMAGEVDVVVLSGSLPSLPKALMEQVRIGGRIAAIVGDAPAMTMVVVHRTGEQSWKTVPIFETVVARLHETPHVSHFTF